MDATSIAKVREDAARKATIEVHALEHGSLASVHACADSLLAGGRPLHVLFAFPPQPADRHDAVDGAFRY